MREFPCFNLGKSVYLILQGYTPVRTTLAPDKHGNPKLTCFFHGRDVGRHARVFHNLHTYALDVQNQHGVAATPDQLMSKAGELWDAFEAEGAEIDAAKQAVQS